MAPKFHDLTVSALKQETAQAKVIYFDIPADLQEAFEFVPGQYLTLKAEINGEEVRRAYSICTSKIAGEALGVGVKRVEGGKMSNYLNSDIQVGDSMLVMPPLGNFKHAPQPHFSNHYVLLGGGSGVTPLVSIFKSVLLKEPNSKVTLIYANRDENSIMFNDELVEWSAKYADRFKVINHLDSQDGFLAPDKLHQLLNTNVMGRADYFICGPSPMMLMIDNVLIERGVPKDNLHREYFTAKVKEEKPAEAAMAVSDTPLDEAEVTLTLDGDEFTIPYKGEDSLLETALDNDVDVPYACQIGACCTCRAKVTVGKVLMEDRESLSDEEIDEGYVLTCQAKPLTPKVTYSYDD